MNEDDLLIITADHGNDPSTPSTDHDREYIPILVYGKNIKHGRLWSHHRQKRELSHDKNIDL